MPSEYNLLLVQDQQIQDQQQQQQVKLCSLCHKPLLEQSLVYISEPDPVQYSVCAACQFPAQRNPIAPPQFRIDVDADPARLPDTLQNTRRPPDRPYVDQTDIEQPIIQDSDHLYHGAQITPSAYVSNHTQLAPPPVKISTTIVHHHTSSRRFSTASSPLTDITRLRVRSQVHHCLYPGSTFQGTQKSGRNSYDVTVTIVDVDFTSSFLCGYLRIRGLTDDWPELTTYFDAEIIGSRYGFLTQNWGANEQEDMVHWSRFPAFKHVKGELKGPLLTIPERDHGAVFMRWKERFLVPDHRVQDINGASFAGFYYVCVDFSPHSTNSTHSPLPVTPETEGAPSIVSPRAPLKVETNQRTRRSSSVRRGVRPSLTPPRHYTPPTATMSGFYFHQNSEPYQQLSLSHVPDRFSSSFEFR